MKLILSKKYIRFLKYNAPVEFLEGTTAAGKTTVGVVKFLFKIAQSEKKYHIIAAKDVGTAEKNIINKDLGIMDNFGALVQYNGNGTKDEKIPHILYKTGKGDKVIYIMGYGDQKKWQKALGGQYGCLYIDEINTADIDFVREAAMRCDYFMGTLNPDDPNLPVYDEYINRSRPLPEYRNDAPEEINADLERVQPKENWTHWFFSFEDNAGLSEAKIEQIKTNVPQGTKLWKNKILGLRGKATGLVFSNFDNLIHIKDKAWAKSLNFVKFSAGLDTAYSTASPDTIAMSFLGFAENGFCVLLDERVYNNAQLEVPLAPSDTVKNYIDFLERNRAEWGFAKHTFIDNADQATIMEFKKHKRLHGDCQYVFNNAWKKMPIIDRINTQLGWLAHEDGKTPSFYVLSHCKTAISEFNVYSWREDKDNTPEDKNDHMINSQQYGWIPYIKDVGGRCDEHNG